MKKLLKDHSRRALRIAYQMKAATLASPETSSARLKGIGMKLRSCRVQNGSQNGGNYQSNRI
jgi:hypothetical protein